MSEQRPEATPPATPDEERVAQELRLQRRRYLEDAEQAAAEMDAAATPLDLRLLQLGNRSIEIIAELGDRQVRGRIVHVSGELATLETNGGDRIVLVLHRVAAIRYRPDPSTPRRVRTGEPSTLIAVLRQQWNAGRPCTIGRTAGPAVVGEVVAVTAGHVEIVDAQGMRWLLGVGSIGWLQPQL